MLTGTGHLKLIDFGTAKYFTVDKRASDMFAKKKKSTFLPPDEKEEEKKAERRSTFVGTALYVSPELLERNECSAPADLWALGNRLMNVDGMITWDRRMYNFYNDDRQSAF